MKVKVLERIKRSEFGRLVEYQLVESGGCVSLRTMDVVSKRRLFDSAPEETIITARIMLQSMHNAKMDLINSLKRAISIEERCRERFNKAGDMDEWNLYNTGLAEYDGMSQGMMTAYEQVLHVLEGKIEPESIIHLGLEYEKVF